MMQPVFLEERGLLLVRYGLNFGSRNGNVGAPRGGGKNCCRLE